MIETLASVIAWRDGILTVEASQKSSCDACTQAECGSGQVNRALAKRYHKLHLSYPEPLTQGTQVVLAIPEQGLLTAVGLMFVLPLICLLVAAGLGQWLFVNSLSGHELWVLLTAVLGGLGGFYGARRWHAKLSQQELLEPKVIRVLPCADELSVKELTD